METGSKHEESQPKEESQPEESQHDESENDESENFESETDESEDEEIGECKYCLKVGDHHTELCSYIDEVPENAIVGESCVVTCLVCGCFFRDSRCANCGITLGHALFKDCLICGKRGEHMEFECPELEPNPDFSFDPYGRSLWSIIALNCTLELKQGRKRLAKQLGMNDHGLNSMMNW
ncbi:unnamed protein product [Prunus armeniaca]|uniref:Uncharacterized protein n=1 Tax=Prunus armeniaca TaxID=36596 RepID=A0A6J5UJW3_PRUAR|nr:unnamed protein product [Prunus armeniaca]